jgi:hypothetical protein
MSKAAILDSFANIDALSTPEFVEVRADQIKEGMVLLDPFLGTPVAGIDHKLRSTRGSGMLTWMAADLEDGGWRNVNILPSVMVKVMAE